MHDQRLLPTWIAPSMYFFAIFKHLTCAMYLAIQSWILLTRNKVELRAIHAYAPQTTAYTYLVLSFLHLSQLSSLAYYCWKQPTTAGPPVSLLKRMSQSLLSPVAIRFGLTNDTLMLGFNIFELFCQSYQAISISYVVPDTWFVYSYLGVVLLHCFISPWIYLTMKSRLKKVMISWSSSMFNFCLTCLLPLLGFIPAVVEYAFFDPTLRHDNLWYSRVALNSRIIIVTSMLDFTTKLIMGIGTIMSLDRMTKSIARKQHITVHQSSIVPVTRPHQRIRLFLGFSIIWGLFLSFSFAVSITFRSSCPSECTAVTTPLFQLSCACAVVDINCMGNQTMQIDPLLRPEIVGATVITIVVSRCSLVSGIHPNILRSQTQVERIVIKYTQMREWSGVLPSSVSSVIIRESELRHVPSILLSKVPDSLVSLTIDSSPLGRLPSNISVAWLSIIELNLINTSLTDPAESIHELSNLSTLRLQYNSFSSSSWLNRFDQLPQLTHLDLTSNGIIDGPWSLARLDLHINLSLNPISIVPSSFDSNFLISRVVILDETTYCNNTKAPFCHESFCSIGCPWKSLNDHKCDLNCFQSECNFDNGDCKAIGFTI